MKHIYFNKISGYKYRVAISYSFNIGIQGFEYTSTFLELSKNGFATAKKGYAWNGANVIKDTDSVMRGSLEHDIGYQLMRLKIIPLLNKNKIDRKLQIVCLEDKMCKFRAWYVYRGVHRLGIFSCIPGSEKNEEIFSAP